MKYLLDTHAVLWLVEDKPRARKIFTSVENTDCAVSVISLMEIYYKISKALLQLDEPVENYLKSRHTTIIDVTAEDGILAGKLPLIHGDPADRLLVAQAKNRGLTLITADDYIPRYNVKTLEI